MDITTTTIKIKKDSLKKLREFEIHPREASNDIIERLMEEKNEGIKKNI